MCGDSVCEVIMCVGDCVVWFSVFLVSACVEVIIMCGGDHVRGITVCGGDYYVWR